MRHHDAFGLKNPSGAEDDLIDDEDPEVAGFVWRAVIGRRR
jgi:hypothetical protein